MPTLENGGLSVISLLPGKSNINCWPFAAFCFWHVKQLLSTLQRAARALKIQYFCLKLVWTYSWPRWPTDWWTSMMSSLVTWCFEDNSNWCLYWWSEEEFWSRPPTLNIPAPSRNGLNLYTEPNEPITFNLRFPDSPGLESGRALTTGEKANFCTYVMIWASTCRNSSIDSLPQGNGSTGSSCKHLLLLGNFSKISDAKQLPS